MHKIRGAEPAATVVNNGPASARDQPGLSTFAAAAPSLSMSSLLNAPSSRPNRILSNGRMCSVRALVRTPKEASASTNFFGLTGPADHDEMSVETALASYRIDLGVWTCRLDNLGIAKENSLDMPLEAMK